MCSFYIQHNKILSPYTIACIRVLLLVLAVGLWSLELLRKIAFNFGIYIACVLFTSPIAPCGGSPDLIYYLPGYQSTTMRYKGFKKQFYYKT